MDLYNNKVKIKRYLMYLSFWILWNEFWVVLFVLIKNLYILVSEYENDIGDKIK